jgi:RimJ/RimL family protein N-acetyltransferase
MNANTDPVPGWTPPPRPSSEPMAGRFVRLEPLDVDHADDLFAANTRAENWDYLFEEPFETPDAYRAWVGKIAGKDDPFFHAIIDRRTDRPVGVAAFMRIVPDHGVIEVGSINYSPLLQRMPGATEAMALMMGRAFDLGYRRYEWKCDAANGPSRAAALRLGFTFEGVFRQHMVVKGRNRDTAWFSITDGEWPAIRDGFAAWLDPGNFDADGRQIRSLADLRG